MKRGRKAYLNKPRRVTLSIHNYTTYLEFKEAVEKVYGSSYGHISALLKKFMFEYAKRVREGRINKWYTYTYERENRQRKEGEKTLKFLDRRRDRFEFYELSGYGGIGLGDD